jgi:hypothetical protein
MPCTKNALGRHSFDLRRGVTFRPGSRWRMSLDLGYNGGTFPRQYVGERADGRPETFGRRYLFSFLRRREAYARIRLNYTLTPDMSLETYLEPFASTGRYFNIGELTAARTNGLRIYGTDGTTIAPRPEGGFTVVDGPVSFTLPAQDFDVRSFRSNAVLRWEWRRGSTLFVVWQQDRASREATAGGVSAGSLFDAFRAPGDDRLLVKVAYWLSTR